MLIVALLAEGVDRNQLAGPQMPSTAVALLAEGVDRNQLAGPQMPSTAVALLAEGVDRNDSVYVLLSRCMKSPSSRRAWIEIITTS